MWGEGPCGRPLGGVGQPHKIRHITRPEQTHEHKRVRIVYSSDDPIGVHLGCHSERSEESACWARQILRCAQNDSRAEVNAYGDDPGGHHEGRWGNYRVSLS